MASHLEARIRDSEGRVTEAIEELDLQGMGPDELIPFDPAGRMLANVKTPGDCARASAHDTASGR